MTPPDDLSEVVLREKAPQLISKGIGVTIGILNGGETRVFGYGDAHDEASTAPDAHTLYGIGSLTKVFTTTLLASLVVDKYVELQQPVRELLLDDVPGLPQSITLLSLATYTSGLPRLPSNIWKSIRKNPQDPYAHYSETDLLNYLRVVKVRDLTKASGMISYSNLGMGLLGYALSKHLRMPYEKAIQKWVCHPLSLYNTVVTLDSEQKSNLAEGHIATGKRTSNFEMSCLSGAGALYSNVDDLLCFINAHILQAPPLADMFRLTLQPRYTKFAPPSGLPHLFGTLRKLLPERSNPSFKAVGIGLGWVRARLPKTGAAAWLHNGATFGYRSFAAFVPQSRTGVVVLSNRGMRTVEILLSPYTVDNLGVEILDALVQRI